jgi:uncharacterized protein (DUF2384 family)
MTGLLDHTLRATHNPESGRFDALRVAGELALKPNEIARILHRTPSGIQKNPDSPGFQAELGRIVRIVRDLLRLLDSIENVRIWLHAPHPELGDRPPLDFLFEGRVEVLETLVSMMKAGQPG